MIPYVYLIDLRDGTTLMPFDQRIESVLAYAKVNGERVRRAACGSLAAAAMKDEVIWENQK